MTDDTTIGIPDPERPDQWLVPPWPVTATFGDVIRHFLRYHPWLPTSTAQPLAYFEGYAAALNSAQPTSELHHGWCADMRDCVDRCAELYRRKHTEEMATVATLRIATQAPPRMPALRERAS